MFVKMLEDNDKLTAAIISGFQFIYIKAYIL